jgi:hypothetical protein
VIAVFFVRRRDRSVLRLQALPLIVSLLALLLSVVALAESSRHRQSNNTTIAVSPTLPPTTVPVASSTSTTQPAPGSVVEVPNVLRLSESNAATILTRAGLRMSVETLTLSNVPSGYVLSQSPLPEATAPAGSTVNLIVSARA